MALLLDYPKPTKKIKASVVLEKFMCNDLLDVKQPVSKRYMALSIPEITGSAFRNALIRTMRDDSSLLAYCAVHELGVMQESSAIPALEDVLCDLSLHPIVRHKAAEALGAFGLESNVPILMNSLALDPAQEVKETCELALTRIEKLKNPSSKPASSSIRKLREVLLDEGNTIYDRLEALFAIRKLVSAKEAVSTIVESLAAKSPILRHGVAYVLSQLENRKATDALSNVLRDPCEHPLVRQEAAKALGSIVDDHCIALLKEFANDPEPIVSQSCEVALVMLDSKRLVKPCEMFRPKFRPKYPEDSYKLPPSTEDEKFLCDLLLDQKQPIWLRFRAFYGSRLGGPAPRNALVKAMRDASPLLAYKAASMLGLIRDCESIPALEAVLSDLSLHPLVRHKAAEALGGFGLESNVPALERSLASDPAPEVRETCEVALGRIADLKKVSPLLAPLGHSLQPASSSLRGSIPILREVLLDENRSLCERHSALFQLRTICSSQKYNLEDPAAAIIESLGATSTLLRCSAASVLSELRNRKVADALLKLLMDPHEHLMVRREAAEGIHNFTGLPCKRVLEEIAARDPEPIVAQSCQVALKMLEFKEKVKSFKLPGKVDMEKQRSSYQTARWAAIWGKT